MKKIRSKSGNTALIALIFVFLAAVMSLVIYMQVRYIDGLKASVAIETDQLNKNKLQVQRLLKLKAALEANKDEVQVFEQLMPQDAEEDKLIEYLQENAGQMNLRFVKISFEPRVPKKGYMEMPLKLRFEGSYKDILALLEKLKEGKRLITVDNIKILSDSENNAKVNAEISAKSFYMTK
jgi:type IV pilus assembly protein PilO